METILQKWGNSKGVRIPSILLKTLNLKANDRINMVIEDNKLIITKVVSNNKISLQDRIDNYDGPNLIEDYDWGTPRGKELW